MKSKRAAHSRRTTKHRRSDLDRTEKLLSLLLLLLQHNIDKMLRHHR